MNTVWMSPHLVSWLFAGRVLARRLLVGWVPAWSVVAGCLLAGGCGDGGGLGLEAGLDAGRPRLDGDGGAISEAGVPRDGRVDGGSGDRPPVFPDALLPPLPTRPPLGGSPQDRLAGSGVASCAVYQEERCVAGQLERCVLYDTDSGVAVAQPSPEIARALLFERWYDLYHQPDGQTSERAFVAAMPAGTSEAIWGAAASFDDYTGVGDAAIWTGVALVAYALRYLDSGTEADYQRLEQKTRQLLTLFEVTGVPGYLARHHYLLMPSGAPKSDAHILRYGDRVTDPRDQPLDPNAAPDLPAAYRQGVRDAAGQLWRGTPMWHGNPSIDQYTGPMVSFPLVHGLLRDAELRARIVRQLTCYLNRLQRIEVRNLQQNEEARRAFQEIFAGGALQLDPGDIDFGQLDTIVGYGLAQLNNTNLGTFDRGCPDGPALTPTRVLDATSPTFIVDLIELVADLGSEQADRPTSIDHFYAPSVRGGDAVHLMHLATMAYHLTGDDRYRRFLFEELVGRIRTVEVAYTAGAFQTPRWCRQYYGDHITFAPLWAFINLLGDCDLRTRMQEVMEVEMWEKRMFDLGNAKFNLMYAGAVPAAIASSRAPALAQALEALAALGGNGGVLDDPRRSYPLDRGWVISQLPPGRGTICPTEEERAFCEDGVQVFGIPLGGEAITHPCSGTAGECRFGNRCAWALAAEALPVGLRAYTDFLWQRSPFWLGLRAGVEARTQSPGLDLIESYRLARHYGFIDQGKGQVLAWQLVGSCQP